MAPSKSIPRRLRNAALLLTTLWLAACGGGGGNSNGPQTPGPSTNSAPTISGTPPAAAKVNSPYEFIPQAHDPDGDTLRFEISGKPNWATFDTGTGRLYGTPPSGSTGTFSGIQISVTDGRATSALPAFSVLVSDATVLGSAKLNWSVPTRNTDGTALNDLAGYRIYYGQSANNLNQKVEIANPGATTTVIVNLAAGTWYFAMSAYTVTGVESNRTAAVAMTI